MIEVTYEQVYTVVSSVIIALASTIGMLVKWIMSSIKDLKDALDKCEVKHEESQKQITDLATTSGKLQGRIEEMERTSSVALVDTITKAVAEALKDKQSG